MQRSHALSSIPDGKELDIDFEIGDFGTAPANDDTEFYYMQLGSGVAGPHIGSLGVAGPSVVRNSAGSGPNFGITVGATVGSIFTDNINSLGGVGTALTEGNLSATRHAISGTASHEIGHALSLLHLNKAGSVIHSGVPPLMGTGAIDLPNIDRISNREFAFSGFNAQEGGAAQFHVSQLVAAVGLRDVAVENTIPEPSSLLLFSLAILGYGCRPRKHLAK